MSEEFIYTDYVNDDKFLSDYNEYQARYAEKMRESDKVLVDLLRKYIAERGGETAPKLLDIGCSTGNLLLHLKRTLPGVEMTGGDLAKSSVAEASENPELEGIDFQVMDIFNLPEASFDIIVVNAVVYMFNDEQYEKSLESIAKALTPGGAAFFFDFAQPHNHELEIIEKTMSHPDGLRLCFRSYKRVNTAIEKAGFESIDIQPFVLPIDLPRPDINGEVISYTIRDENAQRMAFRGALYQPWCHMIAHKK